MFRIFVAFCVILKINLKSLSEDILVCLCEYLTGQGVSVPMLQNYVSAIKYKLMLLGLSFHVCVHPKIKAFIKSRKINRPLAIKSKNVISIPVLTKII